MAESIALNPYKEKTVHQPMQKKISSKKNMGRQSAPPKSLSNTKGKIQKQIVDQRQDVYDGQRQRSRQVEREPEVR